MSEAIQNPSKQDYDNPWKLAVLADENKHWKPNTHHFEQWGFEVNIVKRGQTPY
jgi:hypothetical protein